jgi:hypothetical protein
MCHLMCHLMTQGQRAVVAANVNLSKLDNFGDFADLALRN